MLKIRLARVGRKGLPIYRIVLIDSRKKREGKHLDLLGRYNPNSKELKINVDLYKKYLANGAQPTDIVSRLYDRYLQQGEGNG